MQFASFNRVWFGDSEQLTPFEATYDNSISSDSLSLYPQLQLQAKQINTVFMLREDLDLLQTSLPHLMDSGIRGFCIELRGRARRVNGLKGL